LYMYQLKAGSPITGRVHETHSAIHVAGAMGYSPY